MVAAKWWSEEQEWFVERTWAITIERPANVGKADVAKANLLQAKLEKTIERPANMAPSLPNGSRGKSSIFATRDHERFGGEGRGEAAGVQCLRSKLSVLFAERKTTIVRGANVRKADRLRSKPARRAFTLIELLAVVLIIGVLISLLLPAVQSAREAARRAQCSSHLTQWIMAVHHYEAAHQVYPPGTVNPTGPILNQLKGYHHGWIEQLLPYVESESTYHRIDRDVGVYHPKNRPVRIVHHTELICPSNPFSGRGLSDYAAVHHDVEASIDVDQNGVFFLNSAVTQDDVSDGLGYTIFLGEKAPEAGDLGWMSGTRAILRNMGDTINASIKIGNARSWNMYGYPPGVAEPTSGDMYGVGMGMVEAESVMSGNEGVPSGGLSSEGGEAIEADFDLQAELQARGALNPRTAATFVGGFASFHRGGANFAMGDGSTRFIGTTMATSVYRRLGHRADGELVELE